MYQQCILFEVACVANRIASHRFHEAMLCIHDQMRGSTQALQYSRGLHPLLSDTCALHCVLFCNGSMCCL